MIESSINMEAATAVIDRFSELEELINDHIEQESAQEAACEEAGRLLRAEINRHSAERRKEMDAAEAHQRREEERAHAATWKDFLREYQRETFIFRNYGSAAISATIGILYATGGVSLWLALTGIAANTAYFVHNTVAYATRNNRKGE